MTRYLTKRALLVIPQLVVVAVLTFVLIRLLPANPVEGIVGPEATKATYDAERARLGLSSPIIDQLGHFLNRAFHGDLGTSWQSNTPVRTEIATHLPITLQLIVLALVVALIVGIPLGYLLSTSTGRRRRKHPILRIYSLLAGSQPDFWWGLVFIYLFFFIVHIFPAPLGVTSPTTVAPTPVTGFILLDSLIRGQFSVFWDALQHFALPALTLAFVITGPIIRITAQGMRSEASAEYLLYARAAGLPERRVGWYVARNGLAPVLTLTGVLFGVLLGGAVLVETVFSLDGLGVYTLQSVLTLNYPSIEGSVVVMTAIALLVYIGMDALYALLDPRVRTR
jgi:ABC-type dipeptide/oligopeptide/nickel transport system permease component